MKINDVDEIYKNSTLEELKIYSINCSEATLTTTDGWSLAAGLDLDYHQVTFKYLPMITDQGVGKFFQYILQDEKRRIRMKKYMSEEILM